MHAVGFFYISFSIDADNLCTYSISYEYYFAYYSCNDNIVSTEFHSTVHTNYNKPIVKYTQVLKNQYSAVVPIARTKNSQLELLSKHMAVKSPNLLYATNYHAGLKMILNNKACVKGYIKCYVII